MSSRLVLEEFDSAPRKKPAAAQAPAPAAPAAPAITAKDLEAARLQGYEAGYKEGWDDAVRSESDEQSRIGAEFARNLQDLGFTFHEARTHVMHALEPLLNSMVSKVLPKLVHDTIGQTIVEELLPLASDAADTPIEILVSPASRAQIEAFLSQSTAIPFALVEEESLAEGQVYLRSGQTERQIDMSTAVDRIGESINALYELNEKAFQNG